MTIYFIVVFGIYFLLLMTLWIGWKKASRKNVFISIVIAMRDEKENLKNLFQSLSALDYEAADFEIILVDDHSRDHSLEEAKKWLTRFPSLTIVSLDEQQSGKKAALTFGISLAKGEVIATTDADCTVPPHWLRLINGGFQNEKTNMIIGAVALQIEDRFFDQLQSIEFASVIGTGVAACALGKPTMCNGANLSFRRKIFDQVNGYEGNEQVASGDDEFLMRKIQERCPNSISLLNPIESAVRTKPQTSLNNFLLQRLRWASKWRVNSSLFARILAVLVFFLQASWLLLIIHTINTPTTSAIGVLVLKFLADLIFLSTVCRSLNMSFNPLAFVVLQFLYPVYVLYTGIFSQVKNHQWKGRPLQTNRIANKKYPLV